MAICYTRYGSCEEVSASNVEEVMSSLLDELRKEKFDEPDDEHTQVSIANEHWAVSAQVSGLVTFDNMDLLEGLPSDLPETMYLRDVPDESLKTIWRAVVNSNRDALLAYPWATAEQVAPFEKEYYRSAL